jgi:hypothetical protein
VSFSSHQSWEEKIQFKLTCHSEFSIWWLWWRPFLTLRFPAVIYASLTYGVTLGWLLLQSTADGAAFPAVYGFSSLAVGNISCSVSEPASPCVSGDSRCVSSPLTQKTSIW